MKLLRGDGLGHAHVAQDFGHAIVGGHAFNLSVRLQAHAVAQNRWRQRLHVVGNDEVTPAAGRPRLRPV